MNIEDLTLKGDPTSFEALKLYLEMKAPNVFEDTIKHLDEVLVEYRSKKEFEGVAKYLQFVVDKPYSWNSRRQIYLDNEIKTQIEHFKINPSILRVFLDIIDYLGLPHECVHVMEDFQLDAMDEGIPVMIMVVHNHLKYEGFIVKCKCYDFKWVIPNELHMKAGYMGWKSFTEFSNVNGILTQLSEKVK